MPGSSERDVAEWLFQLGRIERSEQADTRPQTSQHAESTVETASHFGYRPILSGTPADKSTVNICPSDKEPCTARRRGGGQARPRAAAAPRARVETGKGN